MFPMSTITLRLFVLLLLLISSIFSAIYLFSVPLIKNNIFKLELNSNRQVLNVVYDLASSISFNSDTYVNRTLSHHEQRLKSIVELTENFIASALENGRAKGRTEDAIWQDIFFSLRHFKFGFEGYVWISDYDAKILAHPSPLFNGTDMSLYIDVNGEKVIPKLVDLALREREGFYNYKWNRLNETQAIDKYSFVKNMSQWGFVIGAGVYIDDIEKEITAQKEKAVKEIAEVLKDINIANNGYLYVFDSKGNMLFHPNTNINGINFKTQLNSVTGNPIYKDLMSMADTGEELYYKWDRPDDPGHYNYEKLSLTRHLSGFDWYISSSVYFDDLMFSSVQLSQRIVAIGVVGLLVGALLAFLFAKWITSPIRKLSLTAQKINNGDLMAKTGIKRNDELGVLAESFDYMVTCLRDNITTLNLKVEERTQCLSESNQQLLGAVQRLELTQSELRATEARQRLILNALPAQVAYLDSDLKFVFANREYLEIFHETKESIVGKCLSQVVDQDMFTVLSKHIERALQGERVIYEYPLIDQGKPILTRRTVLPFYDDHKKVVGLLTLSIDITKERETEKRLAEASKMKTVGQLSGGLAHDFNNLLTIILGNLLALQHQDAVPELWHHHLSPAIRATRRGADLTRRLLAFSRRQPLSPTYIEPRSLINDVVTLLSAPLPDNIVLTTQILDHCPAIYVDSALMEDALVNLILNSADAMPKGGRLSLSVNQVDGAIFTSLNTFDEPVLPGQYIVFSIQDSGTGFTPEALMRACEPFYTTKLSGSGSGLGLSMVFGFVKQSKGYMRVSNNLDTGACVEILLPSHAGVKETIGCSFPTENTLKKVTQNALVLLIEDNEDVRSVVRQQLIEIGYSVIETSTADEALALLRAGLPSLEGVVSDGVMPGIATCHDVHTLVQEKYTRAFFVLMTGYSDRLANIEYEGVFLQKPFESSALLEAINTHFIDNSGHHNE
ncbi:cache domain-containing protein [Marinomonas sp. A79]|uniref:histidine kinase n=1 Tax=Marinomonas vulgaris TaxID=2823372 RepID=A0ABS5HF20_9GAMM|nr:cache domain-containing protein [Marinomonas vulgaris]MBR7890216.1 cache domain-containing protein [Marinomonas vulgaris]